MKTPRRIVAEISHNWRQGQAEPSKGNPPIISKRFEQVIEVNRSRGFELESWNLSTVMCHAGTSYECMNETIIAVFKELPTNNGPGQQRGRPRETKGVKS